MGNCNGNCSNCSGCARELVLTPQEKLLVQMFRQMTPEQRDELTENARARFVSERYGCL